MNLQLILLKVTNSTLIIMVDDFVQYSDTSLSIQRAQPPHSSDNVHSASELNTDPIIFCSGAYVEII